MGTAVVVAPRSLCHFRYSSSTVKKMQFNFMVVYAAGVAPPAERAPTRAHFVCLSPPSPTQRRRALRECGRKEQIKMHDFHSSRRSVAASGRALPACNFASPSTGAHAQAPFGASTRALSLKLDQTSSKYTNKTPQVSKDSAKCLCSKCMIGLALDPQQHTRHCACLGFLGSHSGQSAVSKDSLTLTRLHNRA